MGFPVLIWLDYYENYNSGRFSGIYTKVVLLILGLCGGILVGYIRVLLGVHTICQVLLGWVIGLWYAFIMHYLVKTRFSAHI